MNYGLYLSASGVLTNMHRQDVIANNLANASTVGFKRDLAAFSQRLAEVQEDRLETDLAQDVLDQLGGGALVAPSATDFRDGGLSETRNDLDLAITGRGFFTVRTNEQGQQTTRLTRDGRFTLNEQGELVTTIGRHNVLDIEGQTIRVDRTRRITVDETGAIRQNNQQIAQIGLADVSNQDRIRHLGHGLYGAPDEAISLFPRPDGRINQGWLEQANVDPVKEMVRMIESTRAINSNATLIRYHDDVMNRAVNTLGRVA